MCMKFRRRNSEALADLICGNPGSQEPAPGEAPKYCATGREQELGPPEVG
jgi:hypothetical protein